MDNREVVNWLIRIRDRLMTTTSKQFEALTIAITALEKQEVDKCCETCKYEDLDLETYPCCDCIRAKDHYIPYTEEES